VLNMMARLRPIVARVVGCDGQIPEGATSRGMRDIGRHPVRDIPFDLAPEVIAQLFVELGVGLASEEKRPEPNEDGRHGCLAIRCGE
jgi:hypothetical protein